MNYENCTLCPRMCGVKACTALVAARWLFTIHNDDEIDENGHLI